MNTADHWLFGSWCATVGIDFLSENIPLREDCPDGYRCVLQRRKVEHSKAYNVIEP